MSEPFTLLVDSIGEPIRLTIKGVVGDLNSDHHLVRKSTFVLSMEMQDNKEKGNVVVNLVDKVASSGALPNLGPFEDMFEPTNGGVIGGNNVAGDFSQEKGWTSSYENEYSSLVKSENGPEMMTGIQPSHLTDSSDQQYHSFGSGATYGHMGQAYGQASETYDHTSYVKNMSTDPFASYQKKIEELTNSLQQTEGVLGVAQSMNVSLQNAVATLRTENEALKSHYSMSYASYNNIFGDLNRAKGLEANLSKKVAVMEREKSDLRRDLDWVMKKAIPKMLNKVFRSDQFDHELGKVERVFVEQGCELGREEARELLVVGQRVPGSDPNLHRKVRDAVRDLKRTKWDCAHDIISSPDLSPNFLRGVLERGDGVAGEGSTNRHVA